LDRRAGASAAIALVLLVGGCGGSHDDSAALQGVAAHRLADEPSRNPANPIATRALTVAHDGLYGRWFAPVRSRGSAVIVFGGSNGGLTTVPLARAFAARGYPALALAYFRAPGLPRRLENIPLEYFERALRFAHAQHGVRSVALVGSSRGGEAALLIASTYPRLANGVIALVPEYQTYAGWSLHGKPVPAYRVIPVERIRGPILTASGGRDQVWSSSVYTEQIELRLADKHFAYRHKRVDFPDAGHDLRAGAERLWPEMLAFMRRLAAARPGPAHGS
jgi:dienelactone hydrolase